MRHYRIENMKAGYFTGNFEPAAMRAIGVEIAIKTLSKGLIRTYYRKIDTQFIVILDGELWSGGIVYGGGDILIFHPYDIVEILATKDTEYLTVRCPGSHGDIYYELGDLLDPMKLLTMRGDEWINQRVLFDNREFSLDYKSYIERTNLTVLIQGFVEREFVGFSVRRIRELLPGATIIVSTWGDCDCEGINADIIVRNVDPGNKICGSYVWEGEKYYIYNIACYSPDLKLLSYTPDFLMDDNEVLKSLDVDSDYLYLTPIGNDGDKLNVYQIPREALQEPDQAAPGYSSLSGTK